MNYLFTLYHKNRYSAGILNNDKEAYTALYVTKLPMTMTEDEIKKRVQEIEAVYQSYLGKLFELKKEQDNIIVEFEKVLTSERIQEIKKSLGIL